MTTKVLRSSTRRLRKAMEVDSEGQTGGGADQAQQVVSPSNDGRSASADYNDDGSNGYRGPKAACVACRNIKVRCVPVEPAGSRPRPSETDSQSSRDFPFHHPQLENHYQFDPAMHHNNPLALLAAAVPGASMAPPAFFPPSSSAGTRPQSLHRPRSQSGSAAYTPANALYRPTVTTSPKGPSAGPIDYDTPANRIGSGASPTNLSLLDVAQAKEAALSNLGQSGLSYRPEHGEAASSDVQPDPIDLGVLTETEASQLFEHFHREMNPFIILFDKHLHTVEFVRMTSTVLFTTLLAVSAKFARPDLYQILRSHAMQLIGRGIMEGRATLGLIQSILCQIYWKEPSDSFAWLRVGIAVRMAYQMYLHGQRKGPLPTDEREARMVLDRERTWICLIAFDHTYARYFLLTNGEDDGFHQTTMIPYYRVVIEDWLDETRPFGVTDDLEQGATFEWIKVLRMSKDIATSRPMQARALADHLNGMLSVVYQRYLDPQSPYSLYPNRRALTKVTFHAAAASFALHRALLIAVGTNGVTLANFMVSASAFVEAFEGVAKAGYVRYWQDQLGVTMFQYGEFLAKIFPKVYPSNQTSIISWLERVYQACESAKEGKEDSTAAFISRFIQLCLRVVCSQPTPTSTPAPPVAPPPRRNSSYQAASTQMQTSPASTASSLPTHAPEPQQAYQPQQPQQNDALSFSAAQAPTPAPGFADPFDPSASLAQTLGGDTAYWESLFPGQTSDWSWLDRPVDERFGNVVGF
ncbi:hypothetical protein BMF94_1361 [Rhodotorula taiwanensis]|uniref:Transcription factor domain-containing protein n=1 Tax=Rhodotorula taiwanensis TaxID=741276 RepID=A0A2S5BFB6_9BASI|nr:hypothetical protein BMF94_1361 [Rhodotorula taiwanensis]